GRVILNREDAGLRAPDAAQRHAILRAGEAIREGRWSGQGRLVDDVEVVKRPGEAAHTHEAGARDGRIVGAGPQGPIDEQRQLFANDHELQVSRAAEAGDRLVGEQGEVPVLQIDVRLVHTVVVVDHAEIVIVVAGAGVAGNQAGAGAVAAGDGYIG